MKIFKGFENLSPGRFDSPVLAVGTFDGVHVGHGAIISSVLEWAGSAGRGSAVLTFSKHPRTVICGHTPRSIIPLHERLAIFSRMGVESAIVLEFDADLSAMEPAAFCTKVLSGLIGTSGVVLGQGARFGRGRGGDAGLLREIGPALGIEVRECAPVSIGGRIVSSSSIRKAILDGDIESASAMLGRPVSLIGTVVKGRGIGAKIGFPTANLSLAHDIRPPEGVWRGRVAIEDATWPCVTSIGRTPTFGEGLPEIVEVHVIGFDGDLAGADLRVELTGRLRGQEKFADVAALVEAIRQDVKIALALHQPSAVPVRPAESALHGCTEKGTGGSAR